jgi:hypothetical protein
MNGLPLHLFTFCDFGEPQRRTQVGNHATLEAARQALATGTRAHAYPMGRMWIEDEQGTIVAGPFWAGGPRPTRSGR